MCLDYGLRDGAKTYLVVISQQLIKEIDGFVRDKALVLSADKRVPGLLAETAENVIVLGVELNLVLVEVLEELIGSQNLGDLDKLVGVALSVEEGLLAEDHGGKHGSETPHVETVVVFLEVDEQLGALEVSRCYTDVVFRCGVIKLGQTPIDQAKL